MVHPPRSSAADLDAAHGGGSWHLSIIPYGASRRFASRRGYDRLWCHACPIAVAEYSHRRERCAVHEWSRVAECPKWREPDGPDVQRAGDRLPRRAARLAGGEPARAEPPRTRGEDAHYAWRRDWQRRLYDAGWAAPAWPTEYGGRGASQTESAIYFEELGRARVPLAANIARPAAGRPDADGVGHAGAEGALPGADPLGRGDLVPGLLRARRRLGPRGAEDARGQGRRRMGRDRPEGVDERRAVLEVVHARGAHRLARWPSTRA